LLCAPALKSSQGEHPKSNAAKAAAVGNWIFSLLQDAMLALAPFTGGATLPIAEEAGLFNGLTNLASGQPPWGFNPAGGFSGASSGGVWNDQWSVPNAGIAGALGLPTMADVGGPINNATQGPAGYTPCPPVNFLITGVGPHQAPNGATGTPPSNGDVAFNPKNFGLTNSQGRKIADSDKPLIFQPDWSQAKIPMRNGTGTMTPAPNKGFPQIPSGLPVGTDWTLPGTDIIGGVNRAANVNRIDLYRYLSQEQANAATRRVHVVTFIPIGSMAKCPH
jgi:hypothetical protein